jgi:hypothetical protein
MLAAWGTLSGPAIEQFLQADPFNVFQHEEVVAALVAHVKRPHDVGVIDRGNSLRLTLKPQQAGFVLSLRRRQDLDGHPPQHLRMLGEEDRPHPARADLIEKFVLPQEEAFVLARQ